MILGAGGQAREVAFLVEEINRVEQRWRIAGYVDRSDRTVGTTVGKYTVLCSDEDAISQDCDFAVGIGDPRVLCRLRDRFAGSLDARFPNLLHPSVIMDRDRVALGYGNVVCAGVTLTTDITIGSMNVFNPQCTVGHDVRIGDGCVINPSANISGGVTIEDGCLVGTGAQILQNVVVRAGATIGAGAVVTKAVHAGVTVVGVPARPLSQ
jgi:sugar O-acyltransferase (sialic acid O-acetyltransferase NeuD family)